MSEKLIPFDMAALLSSDEAITEYLSQVLADGDTEEIIRALGHIARARGMTRIATESGLGRESLYKALSPGAKPRFDTVLKVIRALGVDLLVQPHVVPR
ncbi:putative addiction module antidote protein [Pseudomonas plecoglossicida]|jgi:probable addiction module antidote protein|uniref:Addiction module antidote protein n=1 Tax=Pseudomonas plecoglossicida TaxID=70775 RepID=A0A2A3MA29_PSEDL|nr:MULTISPECIES: addiction module antidote protein [Pseudomonas]KXK71169.1 addiction module antitoxin [Pseudomonas monteilii]MCE0755082.1 putative addiction module antidote protein [Pseudomonas asiatica]MCE0943778.1 putative addiction module antidote protein [Pseudomonas asiatica]MCE0955490.1 putative addiction module antidote protein [Pseudomonas asiatica]MCE1030575.1 putative addiction module antidote protein [Pseudomonas asiatica]